MQLKEREAGDQKLMKWMKITSPLWKYGMPPTAGEGIGIE